MRSPQTVTYYSGSRTGNPVKRLWYRIRALSDFWIFNRRVRYDCGRPRSIIHGLTFEEAETLCMLAGQHSFVYLECQIFGLRCKGAFCHTICHICGVDWLDDIVLLEDEVAEYLASPQ